ncbi:MAG: hypothetical protein M3Y64_06415, partial [Gemmatimonadota bacterium]|nr:hypothetical protein [Gemmatimonadota bacterium]
MHVNASVTTLLDRARQELREGNTDCMNELLHGLNQCRLAVGAVAWREECKGAIVSHPVRELLHLE